MSQTSSDDMRQPAAVIGIVTNGSNDSINKYQPFRVIVEIDTGDEPPRPAIEIELSTASGDESLGIVWDGNVGGPARYVSQPITLDSGPEGDDPSTWGPFEFATERDGLRLEEGEQVVVAYGEASTSIAAYATWVHQGMARSLAVIHRQKAFWSRLLEELESVEAAAAQALQARGVKALEMVERAEAWVDENEADVVKLGWLQAYAEHTGMEWDESGRVDPLDGASVRADDLQEQFRSHSPTEGLAGVMLGLYRTVVTATPTARSWTLFTGDNIMGHEAAGDAPILAALEIAGRAAAAGGDETGLTDDLFDPAYPVTVARDWLLLTYEGITDTANGIHKLASADPGRTEELHAVEAAAEATAIRVREAYRALVPRVPLSRSPVTQEVFGHSLDFLGLDGLWWDAESPVRPLANNPADLVAFTGALRLDDEVERTRHLVKPGPAVPFVMPEILTREGVVAVVSSQTIGAHFGYVIVYFAADYPADAPRANDWGGDSFDIVDAGGSIGRGEESDSGDDYDFELGPWLDQQKLLWISPGDLDLTLQSGRAGCPYLGLAGVKEIQHIREGRVRHQTTGDQS